jgi:NAD(P)-dependent dehydrogenase (short-subunit alcohol dehydrogenase family)
MNVVGLLLGIRAVALLMRRHGGIVTVASVNGFFTPHRAWPPTPP